MSIDAIVISVIVVALVLGLYRVTREGALPAKPALKTYWDILEPTGEHLYTTDDPNDRDMAIRDGYTVREYQA